MKGTWYWREQYHFTHPLAQLVPLLERACVRDLFKLHNITCKVNEGIPIDKGHLDLGVTQLDNPTLW